MSAMPPPPVQVSIPRRTGPPLNGDLHRPAAPDGSRAVLIIHGFKGFKDWGFWPRTAESLASGGIQALRFNLGGSGVSGSGDRFDDAEGFSTNTYGKELADIAAAVDFLEASMRERRTDREVSIGLLGHSRGGGMAILHAARDPRIRALVTWSAISRADRFTAEMIDAWERGETVPVVNTRTGQVLRLGRQNYDETRLHPERVDILAAAGAVSVPWLIVHGEEDSTVPMLEARNLAEANRRGTATARLRSIPGTGHTFDAAHPFEDEPAAFAEALRETLAWFDSRLPGAS